MALRQAEAGTTVEEICRKLGVSSATFFRWKKLYGGLGVPELRELRQLRDENRRLKGLVADLTLDKNMLQEALQKNGDPYAAPGAGCVGHCGVPGSRAEVLFRFRSLPQHLSPTPSRYRWQADCPASHRFDTRLIPVLDTFVASASRRKSSRTRVCVEKLGAHAGAVRDVRG